MTAGLLLSYICAALLLQAIAGVAVMLWRRRSVSAAAVQTGEPEAPALSVNAWQGWRDFRVTSRRDEDGAKTQCSFHLQPLDGAPLPLFKPGQYLTFSLNNGGVGGTGTGSASALTRCYSLSDRPDSKAYRITIKRMLPPPGRTDLPPGLASGQFHDSVHAGDILRVRAPSGRFFIDPDASVPAVFLAGGIGITPMMSMMRWCLTEQPGRPLHLYYGVRRGAELAFRSELREMAASHPAFRLHIAFSCPDSDDVQGRDYERLGRIDLAMLRDSLPSGQHQFYVCGPPPMMQSLVPALREWGVREEDLHFESFGPASLRSAVAVTNEPPATTQAMLEVRFMGSGRTLLWDGRDANLLDFAERNGVPLESGCRSGSCGSCETMLVSGTVHYADKPDYEVAKGYCLPCVGTPLSALKLQA